MVSTFFQIQLCCKEIRGHVGCVLSTAVFGFHSSEDNDRLVIGIKSDRELVADDREQISRRRWVECRGVWEDVE